MRIRFTEVSYGAYRIIGFQYRKNFNFNSNIKLVIFKNENKLLGIKQYTREEAGKILLIHEYTPRC